VREERIKGAAGAMVEGNQNAQVPWTEAAQKRENSKSTRTEEMSSKDRNIVTQRKRRETGGEVFISEREGRSSRAH